MKEPDENNQASQEVQPIEPLIEQLFRSQHVLSKDYWGAANGLAKIGEPTVDPLIEALNDDRTREPAIYVLGLIGNARAVDHIVHLLGEPYSPDTRIKAADALGRIADKKAVEPLIRELLKKRRDYKQEKSVGGFDVKASMAAALGILGDERAVEPLIEMLDDTGACYRAVEALGILGDERAVEPLIRILGRGDPELCYLTATALGSIGNERAREPLVAFQQRQGFVVVEVKWALEELDRRKAKSN